MRLSTSGPHRQAAQIPWCPQGAECNDPGRQMKGKVATRTGEERQPDFRDWIAISGAILGAFMAVLDIQITNASLRDIQGGIAASLDEGTWISTAYLIAEIVTIPLSAWLAGIFSMKRYLIANCALFLMFST